MRNCSVLYPWWPCLSNVLNGLLSCPLIIARCIIRAGWEHSCFYIRRRNPRHKIPKLCYRHHLARLTWSLRNLLRNRIRLAHGDSLVCSNAGTKAAAVDVPFSSCLTPCAYHTLGPLLLSSHSLSQTPLLSDPLPLSFLTLPQPTIPPGRSERLEPTHSHLFRFSIKHIGRYNAALAHVCASSPLTPSSLDQLSRANGIYNKSREDPVSLNGAWQQPVEKE